MQYMAWDKFRECNSQATDGTFKLGYSSWVGYIEYLQRYVQGIGKSQE